MQSQPAYISNRQFPGDKEQLLSAMLAAFSEMIYLYDAVEKRFVFVSENLTEILGYHDYHLFTVSEDLGQLVHPDDLPKVTAATLSLFKKSQGEAVKCNVRIKHAQGQYKWFSIRQVIFSHAAAGEKVQYIFGVAVDIDERKQAEEQIRAQNAAIAQYIFAASHTVRAPLTNILAITNLVDELQGDDIEEYQHWAHTLKDQAEKLDEIIQEMIRNISPKKVLLQHF
jgi:PAS domain S-box-containing protein